MPGLPSFTLSCLNISSVAFADGGPIKRWGHDDDFQRHNNVAGDHRKSTVPTPTLCLCRCLAWNLLGLHKFWEGLRRMRLKCVKSWATCRQTQLSWVCRFGTLCFYIVSMVLMFDKWFMVWQIFVDIRTMCCLISLSRCVTHAHKFASTCVFFLCGNNMRTRQDRETYDACCYCNAKRCNVINDCISQHWLNMQFNFLSKKCQRERKYLQWPLVEEEEEQTLETCKLDIFGMGFFKIGQRKWSNCWQ